MNFELDWQGPFSLRSGETRQTIIECGNADAPGVYLWVVPVEGRPLPYYVGETGKSIAYRHYEHFRDYASGRYNTRNGELFSKGEIKVECDGFFWKKYGWRKTQKFIDNFGAYASHLEEYFDTIQIYFARLDTDRRNRRLVEGTLVRYINKLPDDWRRMFDKGFLFWSPNSNETSHSVTNRGSLPFAALPEKINFSLE